ncbi:MBL fold metallo-hydrolase [Reinekea sp.]|uniref:MBL fold metallo-hydrolase n=1 Tax=Reinekea sp. TaxID=1970455 RepID=UPI00257FE97E|nr:MBL fold metallo-hydrolase [Reinekea sp.]
MTLTKHFSGLLFVVLATSPAWADTPLERHKVVDGVYAIVGELGNRTLANRGNNATFGLIVTSEGVVLIDSGGTYQGAQEIDLLIKDITDQAVVAVINTGGQDHRWLGNDYFKQQGAQIIASEQAVLDQNKRVQDQLISLSNLFDAEFMAQTVPLTADTTFKDYFELELGGVVMQIHHAGPAHTPGDSFVWLPQKGVMFSGDIVYVERMLGVGTQSNSKSWIKVFQTMAAYKPAYLVPGHGKPTTLAEATIDTYDYLVFLRAAIGDFIDQGREITEIGSLDQSEFVYLENFDAIAGRNAQQVFIEMEWE